MERICGIEIKGSEAIMVVMECGNDGCSFVDIETRKIKLANHESVASIQSFHDAIVNFTKDNRINLYIIKKRAKRGPMAGGPLSFKIEGIVQLNGIADVIFLSGQAIAASEKKEPFEVPEELKKYQHNAYLVASLYVRKLN